MSAGVSAEVPRDKPQAWVGRHCRIFWPDDDEWYEAAVRAYDDRIGRHNVWYFYDEEVSIHFDVESMLLAETYVLGASS